MYSLHNLLLMCRTPHPETIFFSLAARYNKKVYGGDIKDVYAQSPGSNITTYMSFDDAYTEWYEHKFKSKLDRQMVLPILSAPRQSLIRTPIGRTL